MTASDYGTYALLVAQAKGMEKEFPHWSLYLTSNDAAYYEGWVTAGAQNYQFQMRLYIRPDLPEVCPNLYVWNPVQLLRYGGGTVNAAGCTHELHTLGNGPGGRVQLCHSMPGDWDATVAHVLPVAKAHLWCEAYCAHLQDGSAIADYFAGR